MEKQYPSFVTKFKNVLEAGVTVLNNVIQENPILVTKEIASSRLSVCESCPGGYFDSEQKRCKVCSCWMESKILLSGMNCPKNYWPMEGSCEPGPTV